MRRCEKNGVSRSSYRGLELMSLWFLLVVSTMMNRLNGFSCFCLIIHTPSQSPTSK